MRSFGEAEMGDLGVEREDKKDSSSKCKLHFCLSYGLAALADRRQEILRSIAGRSRETLVVLDGTEGEQVEIHNSGKS